MFPVRPEDITITRLRNGFTIIALAHHKLPLAYCTVMVKRGSECDPVGKEGLADLTAEMLTLGTTTRDSQRIAQEMEQMGAQYSASSGWDASFLEVFGLAEDFSPIMDVLGNMLLHPTFPQEEMRLAQQRRISRLIQQRDEAAVIADETIVQRLMVGTPYAHPTHGTVGSLGTLAEKDPREFYSRHIAPEATVLLVSGDLSAEEIGEKAEGLFGTWQAAGSDAEPVPQPTRARGRRIIAVNRSDLTQTQIRVGLPGITRNDPAFIPFRVMNYIFGGGGFSSRLMQRIRAEKGYTYGVSSTFQAGRIPGPFVVSTFTPTATTIPAIEEIITVMKEFIADGVGDKELREAKEFLRGSFPLRLETLGQLAGEILRLTLYDIPYDFLATYPGAIEQVTRQEVNALASAYLLPEALTIVAVGRVEEFVENLRAMGDVEVVEYSEITKGCCPPPANTTTHASTT
jgi:zinc protease